MEGVGKRGFGIRNGEEKKGMMMVEKRKGRVKK